MQRSSTARWALLAYLAATLIAVGFWREEISDQSLRVLAACSLVTLFAGWLLVERSSPRGFWSIPSLFLIVAICFHGGLLTYPAFGLDPYFQTVSDGAWFRSDYAKEAIVVVTSSLTAFSICAGLFLKAGQAVQAVQAESEVYPRIGRVFAIVGFSVLTVAVTAWVLFTISALGPLFFLSSYSAYLRSTIGQPLPFIFYGIGVGLVLVCSKRRQDLDPTRTYRLLHFCCTRVALGPTG